MKKITLLIGIMMALMLCITPVAAVSDDDFEVDIDESGDPDVPTSEAEVTGDDFEIVTWQAGTWRVNSYKYLNTNDPDEQYIAIGALGTRWHSQLTVQAVGIPNAPVMVVDTYYMASIYLPRSVDEWEIKFYSAGEPRFYPDLDDKYLKNAGVVNLNEKFGEYIENGICLDLINHHCMWPVDHSELCYYIPEVLV